MQLGEGWNGEPVNIQGGEEMKPTPQQEVWDELEGLQPVSHDVLTDISVEGA